MHHLGLFMNRTFNGRLTVEKLQRLRDIWKRKLVIKGLAHLEDVDTCIQIGLDGIIVSNHGDASWMRAHRRYIVCRRSFPALKTGLQS